VFEEVFVELAEEAVEGAVEGAVKGAAEGALKEVLEGAAEGSLEDVACGASILVGRKKRSSRASAAIKKETAADNDGLAAEQVAEKVANASYERKAGGWNVTVACCSDQSTMVAFLC
jgi:hypothetical protein